MRGIPGDWSAAAYSFTILTIEQTGPILYDRAQFQGLMLNNVSPEGEKHGDIRGYSDQEKHSPI